MSDREGHGHKAVLYKSHFPATKAFLLERHHCIHRLINHVYTKGQRRILIHCPHDIGVPCPRSGGVPHPRSGWGGNPSQFWMGGTPGTPPGQVWMVGGTPSQVWTGGYPGYPHHDWMGYTPTITRWGTPPPIRQSSIASTCYAAFRRRTFLFFRTVLGNVTCND